MCACVNYHNSVPDKVNLNNPTRIKMKFVSLAYIFIDAGVQSLIPSKKK